MRSNLVQKLSHKAKMDPKRVVFPEGTEKNILHAASLLNEMQIAFPIIIGNREEITAIAAQIGVDVTGMEIIDNLDPEVRNVYAEEFARENTMYSIKIASRMLENPVNFGAMLVRKERADVMVAGLSHTTGEVIMSSQMFIGMAEGEETVSSIFLMAIPGYQGAEGNHLIFADCAVCPEPTTKELADIAIAAADTAREVLEWEPRIAMLSFSTKGSAAHPKVDHVNEALALVKERRPDLTIDGEMQADVALDLKIAKKKLKEYSPVAGKANILIFPDLNAGNISYKLVQKLTNAYAYGPFLQGFKKTVCDLSRGSTVGDIVGLATMAVVRAQTHE